MRKNQFIPRVAIVVSGGLVQNVYADSDVDIEVIDLDTDDPIQGEEVERQYVKLEKQLKLPQWRAIY